jgi:hypothetical protein
MPDKVTKEIIYARLEEVRRLAELIRDAHHDCVFNVKGGGKRSSGCLIPEITPTLGPACGEPGKIMPAQVLDALRKLESSVQDIIIDFAEFYKLDAS